MVQSDSQVINFEKITKLEGSVLGPDVGEEKSCLEILARLHFGV